MNKPTGRTIRALLTEMADRDPSHEALVDGTKSWTYAQMVTACDRFSAALLAAGIERGDRIGILAGNRAEWLVAHFGSAAIGAISVGLNTWSSAAELAYQLDHAKVKLIVLEPTFINRDFLRLLADARALADGLNTLDRVVTMGAESFAGATSWDAFLDSGRRLTNNDIRAANGCVLPDDVACLLYTSGSTALPKGVPLLHRGLIDNMWEIGERQHLTAQDRLWLAVSLFWSLASVNALYALLTHHATIVLQHHFDAAEALELIERERCSVFYGTPNMALALAEHPSLATSDLSSLRTGVTIGTAAQVKRVADLGVSAICNVYGLTEAYGNSTVTDNTLPLAKRIETVGQVLAGQAIQIIDPETLAALPSGETGEITLRGNVTPGYWLDPDRTAEAFTPDGWFRTGDFGFLDGDGFLYYRGRLKEMIKTGGINVAPAEVEQVLSRHPAVELAFVTGIADDRLDEAVAAVIVFRTGRNSGEDALRKHCKDSLAAYKIPRYFRFVKADDLPLTTTGKLQRNRLATLFAGNEPRT